MKVRKAICSKALAIVVLAGAITSAGCAQPGHSTANALGIAAPDATTKGTLLYAVGYDDYEVSMFTYPQGQSIGQIRFDFRVGGSCSGIDGAVWITNGRYDWNATQVSEFAHGATTPETQIDADGNNPLACAQDTETHDLAVTSIGGETAKPNLTIFPDAPKLKPVTYTPVAKGTYEFCAYDGSGNLFVDGYGGTNRTFFLIELKKGQQKFTTIVPDRAIESPGGIVWSSGYLLLADGAGTSIYRMKISGTKAKTLETTTLSNAAQLYYSYALYHDVIVAQPLLDSHAYGFGFWKFPTGGQPKDTFSGGQYTSFTVSK